MLVCDGEGMAWELRFLMPNNSGKVGVFSVISIRHAHLIISLKLQIVQGSAVAELCLLANERTALSLVHGTDGRWHLFTKWKVHCVGTVHQNS